MQRPIQFNNHPFKFLLYLEWVLLTLAIISTLSPFKLRVFFNQSPELTVCSLILFGLMGLRLPNYKQKHKIIYTIVEIILIVVTNFLGSTPARLFTFLYLILVTRSCLIFQIYGRLVVTFLSFILFVLTLIWRLSQIKIPPIIQERIGFLIFSFVLLFGLTLLFFFLMIYTFESCQLFIFVCFLGFSSSSCHWLTWRSRGRIIINLRKVIIICRKK